MGLQAAMWKKLIAGTLDHTRHVGSCYPRLELDKREAWERLLLRTESWAH